MSQNYIACAACFILTGERVRMFTVVKGYSVCREHIVLASAPGFDVFKLRSDPTIRSV